MRDKLRSRVLYGDQDREPLVALARTAADAAVRTRMSSIDKKQYDKVAASGTVDVGMTGTTAIQSRKLFEVMDSVTITNHAQTEFLIVCAIYSRSIFV